MADNYLITGYWGEPHVTAENDRGINASIFGTGRFVLPVGQQLRAEYIGNNTIRIYDGMLMDNGAAAGIPIGEFVDLLIPNAGQGMNRNDLIVFQYSQDASTLIEKGEFVVIQGAETEGTATDPELTQGDLLSTETTLEQMPLWRVSVSGAAISAPTKLFILHPAFAGGTRDSILSILGNTPANFIEDTTYPGCYYRMVGSVKEWFNPPMLLGTEYRTTERFKGQVVYTKSIDCGALPDTSSKTTKINAAVSKIVSVDVLIDNGSYLTALPFINSNGTANARYLISSSGLAIQTFSNESAYSAKAIIKYTK